MSRFAESHAFGEVAPGGYRLNFRRVWNDAKHGPCLCNIASARRHPGIATVRALKRIVEFLHHGLHQSMRGRAHSSAAPIANREPQKTTSGGRKCGQLFPIEREAGGFQLPTLCELHS